MTFASGSWPGPYEILSRSALAEWGRSVLSMSSTV